MILYSYRRFCMLQEHDRFFPSKLALLSGLNSISSFSPNKKPFLMKHKLYPAIALLFLAWGCSDNTSATVQAPPDMQETNSNQGTTGESISEDKTKEVLDHHWEAFSQNDMEAVMADYTEESVLITPDRTYKGLDEIRTNFENAFKAFPKDQTTFKLNKSVVDGEVAYILWQAKTPTFNLSYATDTFIVRNGKIISQTYAGVADALQE